MQGKFSLSPGACILFASALLLLPLRWVLGWLLATSLHELGHYIALRLLGVPIRAMEISFGGMRMHTGPLGDREEVICALSGPASGFALVFLARLLPCTALCAFCQSLFNLLPIYPLDGGRVLRGLLGKICKGERLVYKIEQGVTLTVFACLIVISLHFPFGGVGIVLVFWIFAQNVLANKGETRYNKGKKFH